MLQQVLWEFLTVYQTLYLSENSILLNKTTAIAIILWRICKWSSVEFSSAHHRPLRRRSCLGVCIVVRVGVGVLASWWASEMVCYSVYSFIVVVRVHTYHIIVVVAEDYTPVSQSFIQSSLLKRNNCVGYRMHTHTYTHTERQSHRGTHKLN